MRGGGVLLAVVVGGCGHDYALSSFEPAAPEGAPVEIPTAIDVDEDGNPVTVVELVPIDPDPNPGGAGAIPVDPASIGSGSDVFEQEVTLGGGARAEVADYLFVIDGSSSMQRVLGRVLDGIDALADAGVFPAQARIGVMSTLPADPHALDRVHPAAPQAAWLARLPGFGGLVDGRRIGRFLAVAPQRVVDRYPAMGCDAWFAPDDANEDGVPCLVANTQIALYPVIVEAGLTALHQRLQAETPLFRSGATANVIVVSDTHDPGVPASHPMFDALSSLRPSFAELERTALSRQELASFRVHAIAPAEVCTAEDWSGVGPTYFDAAQASGGEVLDVCDANSGEYVDMVRRIALGGAVPTRPVLPVAADAELVEVLVDGRPTPFTLSADGGALVLPGAVPVQASQVRVRYRSRLPEIPVEGPPAPERSAEDSVPTAIVEPATTK